MADCRQFTEYRPDWMVTQQMRAKIGAASTAPTVAATAPALTSDQFRKMLQDNGRTLLRINDLGAINGNVCPYCIDGSLKHKHVYESYR